jgi:hypothetical protein
VNWGPKHKSAKLGLLAISVSGLLVASSAVAMAENSGPRPAVQVVVCDDTTNPGWYFKVRGTNQDGQPVETNLVHTAQGKDGKPLACGKVQDWWWWTGDAPVVTVYYPVSNGTSEFSYSCWDVEKGKNGETVKCTLNPRNG